MRGMGFSVIRAAIFGLRNTSIKQLAYTSIFNKKTEEPPMLTLHHLNNSRSQRILWLLEELGSPYEIKRYPRDATTRRAPPELKAVHPLGKSPVITDGGITIAEVGRDRRLHHPPPRRRAR